MTDTLKDNRTPVVETEMYEVRTSEQLKDALERVYRDGLPGFVIRSSGLVEAGLQSHEGITNAVIEAIPGLEHKPLGTAEHQVVNVIDDTINEAGKNGNLHNDERSELDKKSIHIHRTNSGSGKVFLANAGTAHVGALDAEDLSFLNREDQAIEDLKQGLVDPEVVNPKIYTTKVEAGDTVVFPVSISPSDTHDSAGPVLHRLVIFLVTIEHCWQCYQSS
jgi:hypothetical protein